MNGKIKLKLNWKDNTIKGVTDSQLESDIKLIKETFCQTVVEESMARIAKFAQIEIEGYYAEFDPPDAYIRTDDMRNNSFIGYKKTKGNIYQGGIVISSAFTKHMGGFLKQGEEIKPGITEEEIYTSVWDLGLHGRRRTHFIHSGNFYASDTEYKQGVPHRFDHIVQKASTQGFLNNLERSGLSAVTKQKYSVLRFT